MKIYRKKVVPICEEIVDTLIAEGDIEISEGAKASVVRDISGILDEYAKQVNNVSDDARKILEDEGLPAEKFTMVKKKLASQRGIKLEDEAMEGLADKFIRYFMTEELVEEVYADDPSMRKKIFDVFKRYITVDEQLDEEVKARLKNIPQNSPVWNIEYQRVMREVKRKKGLI